MVVVGGGCEAEEEEREKEVSEEFIIMAMAPERSRTLHNFSFPCLKWGKQKQLRCVKLTDRADQFSSPHRGSPPSSSSTPPHGDSGVLVRRTSEPERKRRSFFERQEKEFENSVSCWSPGLEVGRRSLMDGGDYDSGIEAVRTKLMLDFQTEVDRMKVAILSEGGNEDEIERLRTTDAATDIRPWSLRTRRGSVRKESDMKGGGGGCGDGGGKSLRFDDRKPDSSSLRNENRLPRLRSEAGRENGASNGGEKRPRERFYVSLSKQEIEADFMAIAGMRPPRRPKKRPKHVQRQLDALFPGFWLSEIVPEMYLQSKRKS